MWKEFEAALGPSLLHRDWPRQVTMRRPSSNLKLFGVVKPNSMPAGMLRRLTSKARNRVAASRDPISMLLTFKGRGYG